MHLAWQTLALTDLLQSAPFELRTPIPVITLTSTNGCSSRHALCRKGACTHASRDTLTSAEASGKNSRILRTPSSIMLLLNIPLFLCFSRKLRSNLPFCWSRCNSASARHGLLCTSAAFSWQKSLRKREPKRKPRERLRAPADKTFLCPFWMQLIPSHFRSGNIMQDYRTRTESSVQVSVFHVVPNRDGIIPPSGHKKTA